MPTDNNAQTQALQQFTKASEDLNRAAEALAASHADAATISKATQILQEVHGRVGASLQNVRR